MFDISKFIIKVMVLLALCSLAGVAGTVVIVSANQGYVGLVAAIGWWVLCALIHLLCVDRLTIGETHSVNTEAPQ